jgi:hypothetical protein
MGLQGDSQRWETVLSETFDSGIGPGWSVTDTSTADGGEYVWGAGAFTPTSPITAAWCAGGGADGASLTPGLDQYPDGLDSWLLWGPIELGDTLDPYVRFRWWLDTDVAGQDQDQGVGPQGVEQVSAPPREGDWLGWCVLTNPNDLETGQCAYVGDSMGRWSSGAIPLEAYVPVTKGVTNTVWIAFHFVSDSDGAAGLGAFVDDVELRVNRGYQLMLPLVLRQFVPEPVNLLSNADFSADWGSHTVLYVPGDTEPYTTEVGNIFTPSDWLVWCRVDDEHSLVEVGDAWDGDHGGDPYRVVSPPKAVKMFKTDQPWEAGLMQQVRVTPGRTYSLTIMAHAWSNHNDAGAIPGHEGCIGDPRCSWGVGREGHFSLVEESPPLNGDPWHDATQNFAFTVGIDPTGGTDPTAGTVIWGPAAHIYNEHHEVPVVESVAMSHTITVFTRASARWGFRNNDAYWDDARLFTVRESQEPVEWNYPLVSRGAKIGVHAMRPNQVGGFATELVDAGTRFPVVKAVDEFGWVFQVAAESPDTTFIGRRTWPEGEGCQGVGLPGFDMEAHALQAIERVLEVIAANDGLEDIIDYWEVYNEPDPNEPTGVQGYRALAQLMIETMEHAEAHDLKLALFSLNAGTPEWDEMQAMVETGVFARAREGGHILALHEGTFTSHDPTECWGWFGDGFPEVEGAGCLNFRYRFLYYLLEQRREVVPLVISEWYCGDEQSASTKTLVDAVKWYEAEASKDYYFWATCPFTLGPTSQWTHTDYERVYEGGLVDYMIEVKDRENATPFAQSESGSRTSGLRRR